MSKNKRPFVGNSEITGLKHENLYKILDFRLKMLHSESVSFVKHIYLIDVMAGNGLPTKYSDTTSAQIIYELFKKYGCYGKLEVILNDMTKGHADQLMEKFSGGNLITCTSKKDTEIYIQISSALSKNGTYCILNIDPNAPGDVGFDELISLLDIPVSKEMDLILNMPATSIKRRGEKLDQYIERINATGKHSGWIRKPVKGDKFQWAMMAFFPNRFQPKGAISGWCSMHSADGRQSIDAYSLTNEEKKKKNQIEIQFPTEHIKNTSGIQSLGRSENK